CGDGRAAQLRQHQAIDAPAKSGGVGALGLERHIGIGNRVTPVRKLLAQCDRGGAAVIRRVAHEYKKPLSMVAVRLYRRAWGSAQRAGGRNARRAWTDCSGAVMPTRQRSVN